MFPYTDDNTAKDEEQVSTFLYWMAIYKDAWVKVLKTSAEGYNNKFATYLTENYGTGLETEVLTEPSNSQPYYEKRFDYSDILCVAFITDDKDPDFSHDYEAATENFFKTAVYGLDPDNPNYNPWINKASEAQLNKIAVISISGVALPSVPIANTATPTGDVGKEWVDDYLNKGYSLPLGYNNFIKIPPMD